MFDAERFPDSFAVNGGARTRTSARAIAFPMMRCQQTRDMHSTTRAARCEAIGREVCFMIAAGGFVKHDKNKMKNKGASECICD